jgi:hypothetical protein
VLITVIIGNSSNERFNALQCVIGFFLESKCAAEGVIELLAHMGVSVSTQTTRNMVQSLTKSAAERNRHLPPSQFIYDNFDMDFKVAQPTIGSRGSHTSMHILQLVEFILPTFFWGNRMNSTSADCSLVFTTILSV